MISFDILFCDNIIEIVSYLNNKKKIRLLSTSQYLHSLKNKVYYNDLVRLGKIRSLWYYDSFVNVRVYDHDIQYNLPKSIKRLTYSGTNLDFIKNIPCTITYLTFDDYFNQDIKGYIPTFITHLTFGIYFDQNIKDCI